MTKSDDKVAPGTPAHILATRIVLCSLAYEELLALLVNLPESYGEQEEGFDEALAELQEKAIVLGDTLEQTLADKENNADEDPEAWELGRDATPLLVGLSLSCINMINLQNPEDVRRLLSGGDLVSSQGLDKLLKVSKVEHVLDSEATRGA